MLSSQWHQNFYGFCGEGKKKFSFGHIWLYFWIWTCIKNSKNKQIRYAKSWSSKSSHQSSGKIEIWLTIRKFNWVHKWGYSSFLIIIFLPHCVSSCFFISYLIGLVKCVNKKFSEWRLQLKNYWAASFCLSLIGVCGVITWDWGMRWFLLIKKQLKKIFFI